MSRKYFMGLVALLVFTGIYNYHKTEKKINQFNQTKKTEPTKVNPEAKRKNPSIREKNLVVKKKNFIKELNPYLNQDLTELQVIRREYQQELDKSQLIAEANHNKISEEDLYRLERLLKTLNQINIAIIEQELKEI